MFITFEGIEGCGKSSVVRCVAGALSQSKRQAVAAREPGGTAFGERIRDLFLDRSFSMEPLAEALLVNASRAELVETVIRPALAQKTIVLCDRYTDSTIAYQGYGRGLDRDMLLAMCTAATGGLVPDITFLIDVPVEISRQRVHARSGNSDHEIDRMEREDCAFHTRVRDGYLQLATRFTRFIVLDGCLLPEGLFQVVMSEIAVRTQIA